MDRRRRRHSWPLWPPDRVETTPPLLSSRGLSLCIDIIDWSDIDFRSHNERAKIEQIECLKRVQQGADLCKYGSRGSPHIRFFYVDATGSILRWKSHKKKMEDSMIILSNVSRLQVGQNTPIFERFVKLRTRELKRRSFSLIYGDDCEKTLDIVCSTREENLVWVRALRFLITREAYSKKIDPYRSLLRSFWDRACVRERGVIDIDAVSRLLGNMNITYSKPECKVLFDNAGVHRHDIIDFSTITRLSLRLRSSPKVYFDIFQRYSDSDVAKLSVGLKQFMLFLRTEQNMDMDESEGLALMRRYMSKEGGRDPPSLRIYELISYLTGDQNTLFDPARMNLYQDMTRPLYDYYINSSHNTYLEGDQLKGISSTKMYIKALQEGCRSVEIDCWDGPNGEPVVYHGFTLTSKVLFHEVVQTIQQHAFDTSPFPVTLSLENRCSLPFQRRMAFHLRNILGPMLALPQDEDRVMLPSPSSLQYRIIIKAKLFLNDMTPSATLSSFSAYSFSESSIDQNASESISALAEQGVAPELASMVMLRARKFSSFDMFRGVAACQMTSFSEKKVTKLVKKGLSGRFVCYNTHNLSRVYPSRFRVDSSNLSPFQSWNLGCQMVALNWQTPDLPKLMNVGRFIENNNCGYVLKPEQLRQYSEVPSYDIGVGDDNEGTIRGSSGSIYVFTHIVLTIIGAFHLPKPSANIQAEVVDPYVKINIRGLGADCKEFRTGVVVGNGFNPTWNQSFDIRVNGPHCAMISFQIFDRKKYKDDKVVAQSALPFGCMRFGYRNIPLLSATLQPIPFSTLVVRTCRID